MSSFSFFDVVISKADDLGIRIAKDPLASEKWMNHQLVLQRIWNRKKVIDWQSQPEYQYLF